MSDYIGKHRRPEAWNPEPVLPPGYDAYGQPICTCPLLVSDMPVYDVTCRRHGHLVGRAWTSPGLVWPPPVPTSVSVTC